MSPEADDEVPDEFVTPGHTFSTSLSPHDRARLRAIVRRVHFSRTMSMRNLPDAEIDKFIDDMGPQVMENLRRAASVGGLEESDAGRRVISIPGTSPGGKVKRRRRVQNMVRRWLLRL